MRHQPPGRLTTSCTMPASSLLSLYGLDNCCDDKRRKSRMKQFSAQGATASNQPNTYQLYLHTHLQDRGTAWLPAIRRSGGVMLGAREHLVDGHGVLHRHGAEVSLIGTCGFFFFAGYRPLARLGVLSQEEGSQASWGKKRGPGLCPCAQSRCSPKRIHQNRRTEQANREAR